MNREALPELMGELAAFPGVDGCALADAETGMVWFHSGALPDMEQIGEAAVEFWRTQVRLESHFSALGPLQSAAYSFANRVIALFPCSVKPTLVLVCVAAKNGMAWSEWARKVLVLRNALADVDVIGSPHAVAVP